MFSDTDEISGVGEVSVCVLGVMYEALIAQSYSSIR